jgi:DNA-directed RNA polymerase specialized sigma24 family protein
MQQKKAIDSFINDHYSAWLKHAIGLTKDKVRGEELLHLVLMRFLNQSEEKQQKIHNEGDLKAYINRSLWLSWYSSSSDYYLLYKKNAVIDTTLILDNIEDKTWLGAFVDGEYLYSAIGRLKEYDSIILRLYSKPDFNYKELSAETGIPYSYLRTSIHRALKKIRDHVELQRAIAHTKRTTSDL